MTGLPRSSRRIGLRDAVLIALVALALFVPGLGRLHLFDWDEINFAEAAREMVVTHDYLHVQIDFRPFAEKPPLFMWLQAAAMHVFGAGALAARLPDAITGVAVLVGVYLLGRRLVDRRFGLLWSLAYAGSFLPHLYFRSAIIDPVFNAFIFAGVCGLFAYHRLVGSESSGGARGLALVAAAGVAVGLAVLTKGPVGLLLPGLTWALYYAMRRREIALPVVPVALFLTAVALTAAPWYAAVALSSGGTLQAFLDRQLELARTGVAGHTGPWYYHLVVLGVGCFPASVFAVAGVRRRPAEPSALVDFRRWMLILLAVVVVVFSLVQTKIVHYSSLAYYPITFLAASALHRSRGAFGRSVLAALAGLGLVWATAFIAVPIVGLEAAAVAPHVRDAVVRAALAVPVRWSRLDLLLGVGYALVVVACVVAMRRRGRDPAPAVAHELWWVDGPAALLFGSTAVAAVAAAALLFPKVERYTQGAPIDFYERLRGRDAYVAPLGFKSYAHLFYAAKTPDAARRESCGDARGPLPDEAPASAEAWLLRGAIDRPAYFVAKVDKADRWRATPGLRELGARGGFVFFERAAVVAAHAPACLRSPA